MDNVLVPLIVAGTVIGVRPLRRRAIAVGKASWSAGFGLTAAAVAGTVDLVKAVVTGEQPQPQHAA